MPIYEYKSIPGNENQNCDYCRNGFENIQSMDSPRLTQCPKCKGPVRKIISQVGVSYAIDFKAKDLGMTKLVRRDKGTYEKVYGNFNIED